MRNLANRIIIVAAALSGCTVGPDFKRPDPPAIANWHDASVRLTAPDANVARRSIPIRYGGTNLAIPP
jgi:hypothetical protein